MKIDNRKFKYSILELGKSIIVKASINSLLILLLTIVINAQSDSGFKQIITSDFRDYPNGNAVKSGDSDGSGRFLVFESNENIATYNPRNVDKNWEIFLLDYAQRHIFQLTDTKSALVNTNNSPTQWENISVLLTNVNAKISNDGKWIVFSSNATTSTTNSPNNTNPGNLDGNATGIPAMLQQDGNLEIWLYQLPTFEEVTQLSTGAVPDFVNLGAGTFRQVTNSLPTNGGFPPVPGTSTQPPKISKDNNYPSINDNGDTISFISNRNLVNNLNPYPSSDNDEVFVYKRNIGLSGTISQVTVTPRTSAGFPIYQFAATISGNGDRVTFQSNARTPIPGMIGTCNEDFSQEVFFTDLDSQGSPDGIMRQVTYVDTSDLETKVLMLSSVRSLSRDGRFIIFWSRARHTTDKSIALFPAYFLFDTQAALPTTTPQQCNDRESPSQFHQIGPRFDADPVLGFNGFITQPTFTDYSVQIPSSVVFTTRMNFRSDGTVPPSGSTEGLNPSSSRPQQIYSFSLGTSTSPFTRLTNSQSINWYDYQSVNPSNSKMRIFVTTGSLPTQQSSSANLKFYNLLTPNVTTEDATTVLQFFTGAGALPINGSSPLAQGLMPNMLGSVTYTSPLVQNDAGFASAVSNSRNFVAPLQINGVSLTIDGISANITSVLYGQINFIVPKDVTPGIKPVVINHKGIILRGSVQIIQTPQPDILRTDCISPSPFSACLPSPFDFSRQVPGSNGRAIILDITDPNNPKVEPFTAITKLPSGNVPTKLRLFLTGVQGVAANAITINLGSSSIQGTSIITNAVESDYPGVFSVDFLVPPQLAGAGHIPVTVTVTGISSRMVGTAPRTRFLPTDQSVTDLAVWHPGNGTWYILST